MIKTIVRYKDGSLHLNTIKKFVRPFWLTPDAPNQTMNLLGVIGNQAFAPMTVTQEGPFQGYSMMLQSTRFDAVGDHECLVELSDAGSRKRLMNRPCHANTIFGNAAFPAVLPERLYLSSNRSLSIRFQNLFANANALRPAIHGRRIYATSAGSGDVDEFIADLSEYSEVTGLYFVTTTADITAQTVAAGAQSFFFPVDADSYLEVFKMAAAAYDVPAVGAPTLNGTFNFILRDAETRRELETGNLTNQIAVGTGQFPFVLAESWLIEPKQRIEIVVTNTNASGNPLTLYFTLIGRRVFI